MAACEAAWARGAAHEVEVARRVHDHRLPRRRLLVALPHLLDAARHPLGERDAGGEEEVVRGRLAVERVERELQAEGVLVQQRVDRARRVGDLLYLSGVGPRQAGTDAIPGGPIRDSEGRAVDYDIEAQTRAVIDNVRRILEASGSSLDRLLDVTTFLVDMDRDFKGYNRVYAELLGGIGPTRTTLAIRALPTPIAIELKVVAAAGDVDMARLTGGPGG